jgi:hypothetical protein
MPRAKGLDLAKIKLRICKIMMLEMSVERSHANILQNIWRNTTGLVDVSEDASSRGTAGHPVKTTAPVTAAGTTGPKSTHLCLADLPNERGRADNCGVIAENGDIGF